MALKRKQPAQRLGRRVRAKKEDEWDPEADVEESNEEVSEDGEAQDPREDSSEDEDSVEGGEEPIESDGESNNSQDEAPLKVDLTSVTFGALAKAQASLPEIGRRSKKSSNADATDEKPRESAWKDRQKSGSKVSLKRSSKHAPQEQTSKRAVSRMREILPDLRRKYRDPRFGPLGGDYDESKAKKAYAFLDEYRDSEMATLRADIKKTKDPAQKEHLKRQLMSMESRRKATKKKEEQENVLAEHRKKEKDMVAQGKKPFYLKKSEQKKMLLTDRFNTMSKGQVDKAIERKRKKIAGRERKELDGLTRRRRPE